ncbi:MAG: cytidylyltransferase domain-containing protein [Candidatus Ratteibacteria bacterium]
MNRKANIVAIIPARGGSKGIPKKNIINFCGKPLIAWTIIQSLITAEIDDVFVSSDSDEILNIAKNYGAKGIKRPIDISDDTSPSELAVAHALKVIGFSGEIVIMLQATSPLRKPHDLSRALAQFKNNKWDSLFSAAILEDFLIWKRDNNGMLYSFNYDYKNRRMRQSAEPQFVENGSFYIFKPDILLNQENRLGGKIGMYFMEFWQSFEIDNLTDLDLVEMLFEKKLKEIYLDVIKKDK